MLKIVYLRKPYGNCIENVNSKQNLESDLAIRTFYKFGNYSLKNCFLTCLNDFLNFCCNVSLQQFRNQTGNFKNADVITIEIQSKNFWNNHTLVKSCNDDCPIECLTVDYSLTTSQASYPNNAYQNVMKTFFTYRIGQAPNYYNFTDFTDLERKTLAVNIFYRVNK